MKRAGLGGASPDRVGQEDHEAGMVGRGYWPRALRPQVGSRLITGSRRLGQIYEEEECGQCRFTKLPWCPEENRLEGVQSGSGEAGEGTTTARGREKGGEMGDARRGRRRAQ